MDKILIIEDDEKLRNELEIYLNKNGYIAKCIIDFKNVIELILKENVSLVLLDINLPYTDGMYICKELRKKSNVPIIMVTSNNSEISELLSLNSGADQYVTKPYNIQILLAKIEGLIKRSKKSESIDKIEFNGIYLNVSKSELETPNNNIELTKNELKILHYMLLNRDKIVSREEIMEYLWDTEIFVDDNTLAVNMKRLRDKIKEAGIKDIIETKRGQGYILK